MHWSRKVVKALGVWLRIHRSRRKHKQVMTGHFTQFRFEVADFYNDKVEVIRVEAETGEVPAEVEGLAIFCKDGGDPAHMDDGLDAAGVQGTFVVAWNHADDPGLRLERLAVDGVQFSSK